MVGEVPPSGWLGDYQGFLIYPKSQCVAYNAEGTQYQLFRDMGLGPNSASAQLARTYKGEKVSWYLRTLDPQDGCRAFVNADPGIGYPVDMVIGGFNPYGTKGLVPGFSI